MRVWLMFVIVLAGVAFSCGESERMDELPAEQRETGAGGQEGAIAPEPAGTDELEGVGVEGLKGREDLAPCMEFVREVEKEEVHDLRRRKDLLKLGGRTFVTQVDGFWYEEDALCAPTEMEVVEIDYESPEFEELLKRFPQAAEFRSAGENVVLIFEGKVYKLSK